MNFGKKIVNINKICSSYDDKLKVKIIKNRYNFDISFSDLITIAASILDDSCKKDIISYLVDSGFYYYKLIKIICSVNDDKYKDLIVKNYKDYYLDESYALEIVKSMSEFSIKEIVYNHLSYSFTDRDLVKIISFINDDKFLKYVITNYKYFCFDNEDIAGVISSLSSDEDKLEFLVNSYIYKFNSYCKSIIIASMEDDDFKHSIVINYMNYRLDSDDVVYIIDNLRNKEKYLKSLLCNYEMYEFDKKIVAGIVSLMNDLEKESILLNNTYGFSPILLCRIIKSFSDNKKRQDLLEKFYSSGTFGNFELKNHICLPSQMTIGIEIESEGVNSNFIDTDLLPNGWNIHAEASLNHGTEVVSPVLNCNAEEQIVKVCNLLKSLSQIISQNCAGHIHIGADYFDNDVECFKVLLELFSSMEKILFLISNEKGTIPRNKVFTYSSPISNKVCDMVCSNDFSFEYVNDVNHFSEVAHELQNNFRNNRYSSINFENLGNLNKNTIEFRMPNGTLEPDVWINNINLFGNLIWISKKISNIRKKDIACMSEEEKLLLYFYEKMKDVNISDRNRLKYFLALLPSEIDKDIYLKRYDLNNKIVQDYDVNDVLKDLSLRKWINITACSSELRKEITNSYRRHLRDKKRCRKL